MESPSPSSSPSLPSSPSVPGDGLGDKGLLSAIILGSMAAAVLTIGTIVWVTVCMRCCRSATASTAHKGSVVSMPLISLLKRDKSVASA